jgi:hypothetical protein
MDRDLLKYKKALELFTDELKALGEVDDGLAYFLIDETECFDDCPEIDGARQLIQEAYQIIKDYQTVQLLWVEESNKDAFPQDDIKFANKLLEAYPSKESSKDE